MHRITPSLSLPCRYNHKTGEWAHTTRLTRFPERKWLSHFDITSDRESEDKVDPNTHSTKTGSTDSTNNADQMKGVEGAVSRAVNSDQCEVSKALASWNASDPQSLFTQVKNQALSALEVIQANQDKLKAKKMKSSSVRTDGEGVAALTAFQNIRWFAMADDVDIQSGSDGCDMMLKGTSRHDVVVLMKMM